MEEMRTKLTEYLRLFIKVNPTVREYPDDEIEAVLHMVGVAYKHGYQDCLARNLKQVRSDRWTS